MVGQWPLTGRDAELAELRASLQRGRGGLLLSGPSGVGKTRLATELLHEAQAGGHTVLRVAATRSSGDVPFGAFAALLPDLEPGTTRVQVLRQIVRAITDRGHGHPVTLLVDDAHLLDTASASLVHQLALGPDVFVLATVRPETTAPDAVLALWKDGLVDRVEIGPLTHVGVVDLLTAALGATVERRTSRRLYERSAGNALFLRELVIGALDAGALQTGPAGWTLTGPMPSSARLIELVDARIGVLAEGARDVLELVALGEPLSADVLSRLAEVDQVESLLRQHLITEEGQGPTLAFRLGHPVYGEVLRVVLSASRTRALYGRLADALDTTTSRTADDVLRLATWRLEAGATVDTATMHAAAERAWTLHELGLAERLTNAAISTGGGFEPALLLGQVLCAAGRPQEAEDHLAALASENLQDRQLARVTIARLDNLCYSLGRLDIALDLATQVENDLTDPGCRDEITAQRASLLDTSGQTAQSLAVALPLLERTTGLPRVWASVMATLGLAKTGSMHRALEISEQGLASYRDLEEQPLQWGLTPLIATRCWALHFGGRLADAEAAAIAEHERGMREGAAETEFVMGAILAMINVAQGRIQTAARRAREAADLAKEHGRLVHVRLALISLTEALALSGEADAAAEAFAELEHCAVPHVHMVDAEVHRAGAWVRIAASDQQSAHTMLTTAADIAAAAGDRVCEVAALHDIARLGQPRTVAARLAELATLVDGQGAQTRSAHAVALAAADPRALLDASSAFADIGALILAAEAAADAAVVYRKQQEKRLAQAAQILSAQIADRCEGAKTLALSIDTATRAVLSPRELEIARYAAAGRTDKDIAAQLFISHRTVENRLQRAYAKLGITSRHDLAAALDGLESS